MLTQTQLPAKSVVVSAHQSQGSRLCKCSVLLRTRAARYNTWLLIKLAERRSLFFSFLLLHSVQFTCRRGEEVQRGVAALQREREALEAGVLDMAGKTVALDRWLADNEAKIPEGRHAAAHLVVLTKLWSCCIMRMLADAL